MNHLPSLNAFNLSKDFIFFRLFLFFFSSSVQRKFLKKKKKRKKDDRIALWEIDGHIFLLEESFYQESFLVDISKKKRRSPFFPRKKRITPLESLTLSRRLKETFHLRTPLHFLSQTQEPTLLFEMILRTGKETSRLVSLGSNSRFSLARSQVFIARKTGKKKTEKAVARFETNPPPSSSQMKRVRKFVKFPPRGNKSADPKFIEEETGKKRKEEEPGLLILKVTLPRIIACSSFPSRS